jgi:transposase-like protein
MTDHITHRTKRHGKTDANTQRYYCHDCKVTFTLNGVSRGGKKCLGDQPLTAAEKMRRYREKRKNQELK